MPLVQVDLDRALFASRRDAISAAIHQAQIEALGIPANDKFQVFRPYDDGANRVRFNQRFAGRPNQIVIHLTMVRRYSVAVKMDLYRQILLNLGRIGIDPNDVHIPVVENGFEDWCAGLPS
jgi:tautomerase-like protein